MRVNKYKELCLIIIAFIIGSLVMILLVRFSPLSSTIIGSNRKQIYEKTSLNKAVAKIYDAVVLIEVYNGSSLKNTGTGFFYKVDNNYGYILTNEHILASGDNYKLVTSKDEETTPELLGKNSYLDLAVLRVDKKYVSQIATIGNSENSRIGDTVFIVGSPLGYNYRGSVAGGIISGKDRSMKVPTSDDEEAILRVIQVDASINPGNSGGPLLNINGEVIGIVSLKLVDDDVEGMGFAIPIEDATNYLDRLEKQEEIVFPKLDIKMSDSNDTSTLYKYDLDLNQDEGVVVLKDKDGLKKGDIIIKVNNKKVKNILYLNYELSRYKVKDKVEITYLRNGREKKIKITLS